MKTRPETEFVLVRTPRIAQPSEVTILKNFGEGFDFSNYSFWRLSPSAKTVPMEEWVLTAELELYERTN